MWVVATVLVHTALHHSCTFLNKAGLRIFVHCFLPALMFEHFLCV